MFTIVARPSAVPWTVSHGPVFISSGSIWAWALAAGWPVNAQPGMCLSPAPPLRASCVHLWNMPAGMHTSPPACCSSSQASPRGWPLRMLAAQGPQSCGGDSHVPDAGSLPKMWSAVLCGIAPEPGVLRHLLRGLQVGEGRPSRHGSSLFTVSGASAGRLNAWQTFHNWPLLSLSGPCAGPTEWPEGPPGSRGFCTAWHLGSWMPYVGTEGPRSSSSSHGVSHPALRTLSGKLWHSFHQILCSPSPPGPPGRGEAPLLMGEIPKDLQSCFKIATSPFLEHGPAPVGSAQGSAEHLCCAPRFGPWVQAPLLSPLGTEVLLVLSTSVPQPRRHADVC